MKEFFVVVLLLLLFFVNFTEENFTLPVGYVKCNINSADFYGCALSSFDQLVSNGIQGIPSLDILPLDPVFIPTAFFKPSSGAAITLQLELRNLTFTGLSKLKLKSVQGTNINENAIKMVGFIPQTKVVANYTMSGNILRIPIAGSGSAVIRMNNMTLTYKSVHVPTNKNGKTYLTVKNVWLNADVQGGNVSYKSAKKTNILGLSDDDINRALNQNFLLIYEEYKPMINKIMVNIISPRIFKFNDQVALEDLFVK